MMEGPNSKTLRKPKDPYALNLKFLEKTCDFRLILYHLDKNLVIKRIPKTYAMKTLDIHLM